MLKLLFFLSFLIIFYTYVGYGILLFILIKIKRFFKDQTKKQTEDDFLPEVTMIVAAYNEIGFIEKKIRNSLALNYPAGKLKWIFITDGSQDGTAERIRRYDEILLLHQPDRLGKVAAMNRAMQYVKTPIVIFSDANNLLNSEAVKEIIKHYRDPKVGGVAGEKKIISNKKDNAAGAGEGIYWKYESMLKKLDSELYSVVGAAGELFSVRTSLFYPASENTIIEDFVQSLQVCIQGYVIRYEPKAYATESASISIQEEQKRKIRIAAGGFQAMVMLNKLFNIFRFPVLSFQFISHRVLRWTLCPICLIVCFLTNTLLVYLDAGGFYVVVFLMQTVFYAMALLGWLTAGSKVKMKALYIPYYFVFMNLSVFIGLYRYIRKRQTAIWEQTTRNE